MSDELKNGAADADLGDMFSGMKKKSKKAKKVVAEEEEAPVAKPVEIVDATAKPVPAAAPAPLDDPVPAASEDLDFSDLKKKKKKKTVRIASDEEDSPKTTRTVDSFGNETITENVVVVDATKQAEDAVADGDDEFADLKKKKRKGGKKSTFDLEAFEKELAEADASAKPSADGGKEATPVGSDGEEVEGAEGLDEVPEGEDPFTKTGEEEEGTLSRAEAAAEAKAWLKEDRDYHYTELLGRFYGLLYVSHPSLSSSGLKKRYTLAPPSMHREGNKRSVFANVAEICKKMHRSPEHVIMFLFAELGTSGSVDGGGRLVIKGRFQQKQIENVLRRYIVEYVTCKTCRSPDTQLTKDNRLFFIACDSCGSSRSVSAIKSGFQAQTGKRRAMRPAT